MRVMHPAHRLRALGLWLGASAALALAIPLSAQDPTSIFGEVSPRQEPENVTAAPVRRLEYRIVPEKSDLSFELPTTLHLVRGKVTAWKGEVLVEPAEPGIVHASIDIKAASLVSGSRGRDADMHEKVLEADRFPDIVFEAKSYKGNLSEFGPGKAVTVELTGELTIHGVTRPVQTSVECNVFADHAFLAGEVPIHWKEFGLRDMSRFFNKVKDPMTVFFRLWAVPENSPAP